MFFNSLNNSLVCSDGVSISLKSFSQLAKSYSGSAFLLASGASAENFPIEDFKSQVFFAMNGSIVKCIECNVHPEFYVCDDPNFVVGRPDLAIDGVVRSKNVAMGLDCFNEIYKHDQSVLIGKNLYLLTRANRYHDRKPMSDRHFAWSIRKDNELKSSFSLFRSKPNRIGFSMNMNKGYFVGRTIPYAALQLSFYMGFSNVFLVGMDLNPSVGRFYEGKGRVLPTTLDEDYFDYIEPSFKFLSKEILSDKFRVYNLSKNSRLPGFIIPKVDVRFAKEVCSL